MHKSPNSEMKNIGRSSHLLYANLSFYPFRVLICWPALSFHFHCFSVFSKVSKYLEVTKGAKSTGLARLISSPSKIKVFGNNFQIRNSKEVLSRYLSIAYFPDAAVTGKERFLAIEGLAYWSWRALHFETFVNSCKYRHSKSNCMH